jgi:nicotinate-nucleotide adenylyltransferase
MKTGILGGTFDPVHQGHLDVAEAARAALALDRVILMPARVPSHRQRPVASASHRFAMVALAIGPYPYLSVSDEEMQDDAPSYTVNTLDRLAGRGVDLRQVFFLTGADAFRDIRTWKQYPAVLDRCAFVVVSRPGQPAPGLREMLPELAARMRQTPCDISDRPSIYLVDAATSPAAATDIRTRVAGGTSITDLVPAPVADYIQKHRLYSHVPSEGIA